MKRELNAIKSRLSGIESRLDGADSRFDGIDTRFDGVDSRLDGIDRHLGHLGHLDKEIADTKAAVKRLGHDNVKLRRQFDDFTEMVKNVFKSEFSKLRGLLDDAMPLIEDVRFDRKRNEEAHMRHHDRFEDHERRLARLEARPS